MHGEYKVPGGKLVVVDLEQRDGRIADFHLAGDFFLEPDDALDEHSPALATAVFTAAGDDPERCAASVRAGWAGPEGR